MMILPGDSKIYKDVLSVSVEQIYHVQVCCGLIQAIKPAPTATVLHKMDLTHLVVRCHGLLRVLNVVGRREDILRLLNRIFDFASDKQRCQGRVLVVVLGIAKVEAKLVEIRTRSVKGPNRSVVFLAKISPSSYAEMAM